MYQFGPAAGSSPGIQLDTTVKVLGLSGLRNAYRSVLSAVGSSEINGASRWLDAVPALGASRPMNNAVSPAAAATRRKNAYFFISRSSFLVDGRVVCRGDVAVVAPHSCDRRDRFGPPRSSPANGVRLSGCPPGS